MKAENHLNNLFDQARKSELISGVSEMEHLVLKHTVKSYSEKPNYFKPLHIIIMTSTIVLLIGSILFFNPTLQDNSVTKIVASPPTSKSVADAKKQLQIGRELTDGDSVKLPPRRPNTAILNFKKPDPRSIQNSKTVDQAWTQEPKHVVVPYVPNYLPEGKVSAERCLSINNHNINMMNIHVIELTNEELMKLGIEVRDKTIEIASNSSDGGKPSKAIYSKSGSRFEMVSLKVIKTDSMTHVGIARQGMFAEGTKDTLLKQMPVCDTHELVFKINEVKLNGDQPLALADVNDCPDYSLITDDLGQLWRAYKINYSVNNFSDKSDSLGRKFTRAEMSEMVKVKMLQAEQELRLKIAGFIPILVRSGDVNLPDDKAKKHWRADIIVWFEPTEKLFNALPERISKDLRQEYQSVFVKNDASNCKYFESCKNNPGAVESFQLYPNPSDDLMAIEFGLKEPRVMDAALYTIKGDEVKSLFKQLSFEKGNNRYEFHINELPEGIYLLVVVSSNGDTISKRIIRK